jgi:hypothetical protein
MLASGSGDKIMTNIQPQQQYEIGMVGLGVMGRNLVLTAADRDAEALNGFGLE